MKLFPVFILLGIFAIPPNYPEAAALLAALQ
jgi:hypothetical protein